MHREKSAINASTLLYGIVGYPLGHSISPAMHNAAMQELGINAVYLAFPMKSIIQLKYTLNQLGIRGISVTIPHKIRIRRMLDKIDPLALQIGSVNTVVRSKANLWAGFNTDGPGALRAITYSGFSLEGKNVLLLGSGGSARAIGLSLAREKIKTLGIVARNKRAVVNVARNINMVNGEISNKRIPIDIFLMSEKSSDTIIKSPNWKMLPLKEKEQLEKYDLVIHTSPVGMQGHKDAKGTMIDANFLPKHSLVFDIVYNPAMTPLLKAAKKRKLEILHGYTMLLQQGVLQFELFHNKPAPVKVMEKALLRELNLKV